MGSFDFSGIKPAAKNAVRLTDDQWREIHTARTRGYSWAQIFDVVGVYENWRTLASVSRRTFKRLGLR
jgi:hypothetical protein